MTAKAFDVDYVAKLARLQLSSDETQLFQEQLDHILRYAGELQEVDVSSVETGAHAVPLMDILREDEARDWFTAEEALSNAPRQANGLFVVTKVLE